MFLGVNIDHVATLRQARGTTYPHPLAAALVAEEAGADSITVHLREDRRHIQDSDVAELLAHLKVKLNLEMAVTDEMLQIACDLKPVDCCLVPEKREELTTEGGLDVRANAKVVTAACQMLAQHGIRTSLFIDPDEDQILAAKAAGAPVIELHTGCYADATTAEHAAAELERINKSAVFATAQGLVVNAGHGLNYDNVKPVAAIPEIVELNIGHSIVAQAVFSGFATAVADMKQLMREAAAS